ncbi:hypothetical protein KY312_02070 [Candidatus Woesearchaeota archaeon]|nr:hypothetical protein [Candidatus Woesearchaeota archaeon]
MKFYEKITDYYKKMSWQGKALLFAVAALGFQTRGEFMGYKRGYEKGKEDALIECHEQMQEAIDCLDEIERAIDCQDYKPENLEKKLKPESEPREVDSSIYLG